MIVMMLKNMGYYIIQRRIPIAMLKILISNLLMFTFVDLRKQDILQYLKHFANVRQKVLNANSLSQGFRKQRE